MSPNATPQASVVITEVTDARRGDVLRCLTGANDDRSPSCMLFAAFQGDRILAATGIELAPGRTATLLGPRFTGEPLPSTARALLRSAVDCAWRHDAILLQVVLETTTAAEAGPLCEAGFRHIADLLYLVSTPDTFPDSRPTLPVSLTSFEAGHFERLAHLIERTYEQTCDCPVLNGVRAVQDVLAGYQAVGDFRPENWHIALDGQRDVGCLLLADHPAFDQMELVYLGVIAQARGRGLGYALTRYAQWMTRQAGRGKLVLAVDADNAKALRLYAEAGFQSWDRRSVLVAFRPDGKAR